MSRIEIEITKDNNGMKAGHKVKVQSVIANQMVSNGLAKMVGSAKKAVKVEESKTEEAPVVAKKAPAKKKPAKK